MQDGVQLGTLILVLSGVLLNRYLPTLTCCEVRIASS